MHASLYSCCGMAPTTRDAACTAGDRRAGLLQLVRSDDALAGIIAHEMAHVLARHSAETITHSILLIVTISVLETVMAFTGGNVMMALARFLQELPNSRRNESEADAIGIELAARACFQPSGLASALRVRSPPPSAQSPCLERCSFNSHGWACALPPLGSVCYSSAASQPLATSPPLPQLVMRPASPVLSDFLSSRSIPRELHAVPDWCAVFRRPCPTNLLRSSAV